MYHILTVIAVVLILRAVWYSLHAYFAYSKRNNQNNTKARKPKNSIASWSIMTFITMMNAGSYFAMNNDWIMTILPMTGSIACFAVFCYMLVKGVFESPTQEDLYMFALGIVAILTWKLESATFAHFVIIATFSISVLPILRDVLEDPANEDPTPWTLWCKAFALGSIVVLIRSHHLATDLVYPGGCLIGHACLTFITKRAHAKKLENSETSSKANL